MRDDRSVRDQCEVWRSGRLSTLVAGVVLLVMVVFSGPWVKQIPMAALVAVMIMVSIGTFNWESVRNLPQAPEKLQPRHARHRDGGRRHARPGQGRVRRRAAERVILSTKVGRILHVGSTSADEGGSRHYTVTGQVFFASADQFNASFDFKEIIEKVRIDVSHPHFWDITAVSALDKVVLKFRRESTEVEIIGLNEASAMLIDRFAVHDKQDAVERLMEH
jgi:SulP family sulfate permease